MITKKHENKKDYKLFRGVCYFKAKLSNEKHCEFIENLLNKFIF